MTRSGRDGAGADVGFGRRMDRRTFLQVGVATGGAALVLAGARVVGGPGRALAQSGSDPIGDLAAALDYDVERLHRFVSDEIRYEPYTGALRGAAGTLAARAGNSVDKAALLAALLDASLVRYRFATGRLDEAAAQRLTTAAAADEQTYRAHVLGALAATPDGVPRQAPTLDAAGQAAVDAATASEAQVIGWAQDELTGTLATLGQSLASAGVTLPTGATPLPRREVDEHMWVQALLGTDWLDLDASVPGTQTGEALTAASANLEAIPDDLAHRVELAVIGETVSSSGELTSEPLLRVAERADLLAGQPITFVNVNPTGFERLAQAVSPVAGVHSYVPTLVVGGEAFAGSPIRFGGGEGMADELLGDSDPLAVSGGETTAEWLELTITSPDREPVVTRRTIFDRVGAEARAAGTIDPEAIAPATPIVIGDGAAPDILEALASTWLAVSVGLPRSDAAVNRQLAGDTGEPAVVAQAQHVAREVADTALAVPAGVRSFVDAPNVVGYQIGPRMQTPDDPRVELGLDIWHRSRGVLPVTDVAASFPEATVAGVLDHVVERILLGEAAAPERAPDEQPPASVGAVFAAAREQGVPLRVLDASADTSSLGYGPDARALLDADLAEGWVAVAPERPVRLGDRDRAGWWLVDPLSGAAVDRLDDGRGAEGIEYQVTLTPGQLAAETARQKLARDCLAGTAIALAATIMYGIGSYGALNDKGMLALAGGVAGTAGHAANAALPRCIGAAFP